MPILNVPVTCHRCQGEKQLYTSALGDLGPSALSLYERLDLLRTGALVAKSCPVCGGQGKTAMQVNRR